MVVESLVSIRSTSELINIYCRNVNVQLQLILKTHTVKTPAIASVLGLRRPPKGSHSLLLEFIAVCGSNPLAALFWTRLNHGIIDHHSVTQNHSVSVY